MHYKVKDNILYYHKMPAIDMFSKTWFYIDEPIITTDRRTTVKEVIAAYKQFYGKKNITSKLFFRLSDQDILNKVFSVRYKLEGTKYLYKAFEYIIEGKLWNIR